MQLPFFFIMFMRVYYYRLQVTIKNIYLLLWVMLLYSCFMQLITGSLLLNDYIPALNYIVNENILFLNEVKSTKLSLIFHQYFTTILFLIVYFQIIFCFYKSLLHNLKWGDWHKFWIVLLCLFLLVFSGIFLADINNDQVELLHKWQHLFFYFTGFFINWFFLDISTINFTISVFYIHYFCGFFIFYFILVQFAQAEFISVVRMLPQGVSNYFFNMSFYINVILFMWFSCWCVENSVYNNTLTVVTLYIDLNSHCCKDSVVVFNWYIRPLINWLFIVCPEPFSIIYFILLFVLQPEINYIYSSCSWTDNVKTGLHKSILDLGSSYQSFLFFFFFMCFFDLSWLVFFSINVESELFRFIITLELSYTIIYLNFPHFRYWTYSIYLNFIAYLNA